MAELDTLESFKDDKRRRTSKKKVVSENVSQNESNGSLRNNDRTKLIEEINASNLLY